METMVKKDLRALPQFINKFALRVINDRFIILLNGLDADDLVWSDVSKFDTKTVWKVA